MENKINLQKRTVLNAAEKNQIDDLVKLCNQHDATYTDIYLSNQFNYYPDLPAFFLAYDGETLIGVLNIYADAADEAEIKALVRPEKRRQGIFRFLLQAAREELRQKNYISLLYVVDRGLAGYEKLMAASGGTYTEAEYYMVWQASTQAAPDSPREKTQIKSKNTDSNPAQETAAKGFPAVTATNQPNNSRRVRLAKEEDISVSAQIAAEAFDEDVAIQLQYETETFHDPEIYKFVIEEDGQIVGGCSVSVRPELNYIFGLCVAKAKQRQGLGKALLAGTLTYLQAEGRENIALSVVTDNENALRLYQSCGFVTKTANLYYKVKLSLVC